MSVHQLLHSMDSYEIAEWRQFMILDSQRHSQAEAESGVEDKLRQVFK